jgi:hypothetical protein
MDVASKDLTGQTLLFTNKWFDCVARGNWDRILPRYNPTRVLEIGSYEGASTVYLIESLSRGGPLELHCVDTWEGGVEHHAGGNAEADMTSVEGRFGHNVDLAMGSAPNPVALTLHKSFSDIALAKLLADGKAGYFDFIYIDGSHQAPDVLCDAVLGFKLLKVGGLMAFDDYLWAEELPGGRDPLRCPKPAIDAFINLNFRKLNILHEPLYQIYIHKTAD